ncbi:hypothetical protein Ancab_003871 [Ancistrocladus abbreviatus]
MRRQVPVPGPSSLTAAENLSGSIVSSVFSSHSQMGLHSTETEEWIYTGCCLSEAEIKAYPEDEAILELSPGVPSL